MLSAALLPKIRAELASHYKPFKKRSIIRRTVRTMFGELKVRLSSVKKRSIVRQTVQGIFGELTVRPIQNGLRGRHSGKRTGGSHSV